MNNKRKQALAAGVCMIAAVSLLAGCGPKEIENDMSKLMDIQTWKSARSQRRK